MYIFQQSEKTWGPKKQEKKPYNKRWSHILFRCLVDLHVILHRNFAEVPRFSAFAGGGHDVHHPFCGGCAHSHLFLLSQGVFCH